MPNSSDSIDEIKRKLRNLKKLELKIRSNGTYINESMVGNTLKAALVWDDFFNINNRNNSKSRFTLDYLLSLSKPAFKDVINEYFFNVYYKYYKENGFVNFSIYDPEILKWMGLPPGSGLNEIKRKFRELAKMYHPDTGGDDEKFIELMENYKKLIE